MAYGLQDKSKINRQDAKTPRKTKKLLLGAPRVKPEGSNCSPPPIMSDYDVSSAGCGRMISRIALSADFPLSFPVAMTEAAAA